MFNLARDSSNLSPITILDFKTSHPNALKLPLIISIFPEVLLSLIFALIF